MIFGLLEEALSCVWPRCGKRASG